MYPSSICCMSVSLRISFIHKSYLFNSVTFLEYLQYLTISHSWWWSDRKTDKSLWGQVMTAPAFSCFAATIPYGKGGQIEEAIGPQPTQTRPWILSTELSAKTLVLCEGRKKRDRKGGGEETWLGNLNGTTLSHCMGVWAIVQSITDTALKQQGEGEDHTTAALRDFPKLNSSLTLCVNNAIRRRQLAFKINCRWDSTLLYNTTITSKMGYATREPVCNQIHFCYSLCDTSPLEGL